MILFLCNMLSNVKILIESIFLQLQSACFFNAYFYHYVGLSQIAMSHYSVK